jgi:hypothetical protein
VSPSIAAGHETMSSIRRFLLAVITIFVLGMIIEDPDAASRPTKLNETSSGYGIGDILIGD